jgi:vacuolar iron transporter family protein
MSPDPKRFLGYLEAERNAVLLYRALAETTDGDRREALLELAEIEEHHAAHWIEKLHEYGIPVPPAPLDLDPNDAGLLARARAAGLDGVLQTLEEVEGAASGMYDEEPEAPLGMSDDERSHAEALRLMREDPSGLMLQGRAPHRVRRREVAPH